MTPSRDPFVSVVMPVRDEAAFIERSVGSVLRQDYPPDRLEIIVADGESRDGTAARARALASPGAPELRVIANDERVFSTGFNAGIRQSRGELIAMMGGHAELAPDYIRRCVACLEEESCDCAGGLLETVASTRQGQAIALAMSSRFGVGGVAFRTGADGRREVDTVAFGVYRRSVFGRIGYLDPEMVKNQDDEFNYRLRKAGGRIFIDSSARCRYNSRATLLSVGRQYFLYGYWKVRVMQKHPGQMRGRHFAPPALAAAALGGLLGAVWFPLVARVWLAGVLAYLAACVTAALVIGTSASPGVRVLLAITFPTLHLSYGSGFLVGLVRFFTRTARKPT